MLHDIMILERLGGTTPEVINDMRHGRAGKVRNGRERPARHLFASAQEQSNRVNPAVRGVAQEGGEGEREKSGRERDGPPLSDSRKSPQSS